MKMTRDEFRAASAKTITLVGMSGVGKTHIGAWLEACGWRNYSCDFVIAERYLAPSLPRPATRDDLRPVSEFIGKVGAQEKGGLPLAEFVRRQRLYNDAECESLREAATLSGQGELVIDTTGSFCEITDEALIEDIGRKSLIVYLQTAPDDLAEIVARQRAYPKPLYFPPDKFESWLNEFMIGHGLSIEAEIVPDDFSRWVFPRLIEARLPKYQALADRYGVTLPASSLKELHSGEDFLAALTEAL